MTNELFPSTYPLLTNRSMWTSLNAGSEIDLRVEFHDILYGNGVEIPKGIPVILRRMRYDANEELVRCPCVSDITNEPDEDVPCHHCWGEGFIWDEEWLVTYKVVIGGARGSSLAKQLETHPAGTLKTSICFFYFKYDTNLTNYDKIIEVKLDEEGCIVAPYKRIHKYGISTAESLRSDSGRIEYWRVACVEERVKSNWQE